MVKNFKTGSKRITCRKRYKIIKKVREHNRKLRREQRKHPDRFRGKRKDSGVPNSVPFKEQLIEEAEAFKKQEEEARNKRRDEAKERRKDQRENIVNQKRNLGASVNDMIKTAAQRSANFNNKINKEKEDNHLSDNSAKSYYKEFKKVVECANVILEVLDARDPLGTRCPQMEEAITTQTGKRLVLVLNKADLVPRANLEKWLTYLRREHPTIVFKSCTQTQNNNLGRSSAKVLTPEALNSSKCVGADVLIQLLKNYSRNKDSKMAIDVGVVGLPNVGKSSLINSLKRSKACGVGSTPGFTKNMQTVHIDSKVRLLDSPGIVLPGGNMNDGVAALRNVIKIETLDDPVKPVEAIYKKAKRSMLQVHYRLPDFWDFEEFLVTLAKRLGKLKKGGIPDVSAAARCVLYDWALGRIKYYTEPPVIEDSHISATIVSTLDKEFSLDSLKETEERDLADLPLIRPSEMMCVESVGPVHEIREQAEEMEEDESDESMDEDTEYEEEIDEEDENVDVELGDDVHVEMDEEKVESVKQLEKPAKRQHPVFDPTKTTLKKFQKQMAKKSRKETNRNVKQTAQLTNAFESLGTKETTDDYDFNDFFVK